MRFPTTTVEWADLAARWVWVGLGLSAVGLVLNQERGLLSILFTGAGTLLFLSFMLVPAWRYTTWLRAVARAEAQPVDRDRVLAWIRALRILTGLAFGVLTVVSVVSFLSIGWYALPITLAALLTGFVIFKLLGTVHEWVRLQTKGQNSPDSQPLLLRRLSRWIRATQALSVLGLIAIPNGGPLLSLSSLFAVASTGTIIFALELTLRFVHTSAQSVPDAPTLTPA